MCRSSDKGEEKRRLKKEILKDLANERNEDGREYRGRKKNIKGEEVF